MPIFYNKVERGNPQDKTAPKKWYPSLKTISQVSEKEVAKLIADETTINPKEAEMALSQFQKVLSRLLLDGHSVQLGDWGSFHLTATGTGADTAAELTANHIEDLHIRFTAGQDLKDALKKATFVAAESLASK